MFEHRNYRPIYSSDSVKFDFQNRESYKKADLHLHTILSDGAISPEKMVDIALLAGMNAIAITDHDVIESSDRAINYTQQNNLPIEVIRGMEVSSREGHVLALNIEGYVEPHMPLTVTIKEIHRQNGFAIIAHPNAKRISSVPLGLIGKIINSDDPELYIDGIEVFNASERKMQRLDKSGIIFPDNSLNVRKFIEKNLQNPKLGALLGGTDAHTKQIGYGITVYQCDSILNAIRNRETLPMAAHTSLWEDVSESAQMVYSIIRSHII